MVLPLPSSPRLTPAVTLAVVAVSPVAGGVGVGERQNCFPFPLLVVCRLGGWIGQGRTVCLVGQTFFHFLELTSSCVVLVRPRGQGRGPQRAHGQNSVVSGRSRGQGRLVGELHIGVNFFVLFTRQGFNNRFGFGLGKIGVNVHSTGTRGTRTFFRVVRVVGVVFRLVLGLWLGAKYGSIFGLGLVGFMDVCDGRGQFPHRLGRW